MTAGGLSLEGKGSETRHQKDLDHKLQEHMDPCVAGCVWDLGVLSVGWH